MGNYFRTLGNRIGGRLDPVLVHAGRRNRIVADSHPDGTRAIWWYIDCNADLQAVGFRARMA